MKISGIIDFAKKEQSSTGKPLVRLFITKKSGSKEYPQYSKLQLMAVGKAAADLTSMIDSHNLPMNHATHFAVIDGEFDITGSQPIRAVGRSFDGKNEVYSDKQFNADLPTFTLFKVDVKICQRNAAPQAAPSQNTVHVNEAFQQQNGGNVNLDQRVATPQPANNFDSFDDDIPF